jgi:aspartate/glutamate racemase|tara:strand:- start:463 stop:723 length:261 start_codon:yes stop_codon:yes gene_type:complete
MQSKSSKIQTRPIEDLLGRIRTLRQQGQKQIIIPAKEADQLADSLSQVMTRMVTIQEEIIDALKSAQQAQTVDIEMDGGNFSKDKS